MNNNGDSVLILFIFDLIINLNKKKIMKNLMLSMCLISLAFSCSKNNQDSSSTDSKKSSYANFEEGVEYAVSCGGTCEYSGSCKHIKVGVNTYECPCESCYLEVSLVGEQSGEKVISNDNSHALIKDLLAKNGTFLNELNEHIFSNFGTKSYKVSQVNLLTQKDYFGLIYTFELPDGSVESISFLKSLGLDGAEPVKTKVDCSGPCDSPRASCREKWIPGNPPSAECTCSGECSMTIESMPSTQE